MCHPTQNCILNRSRTSILPGKIGTTSIWAPRKSSGVPVRNPSRVRPAYWGTLLEALDHQKSLVGAFCGVKIIFRRMPREEQPQNLTQISETIASLPVKITNASKSGYFVFSTMFFVHLLQGKSQWGHSWASLLRPPTWRWGTFINLCLM